MALTELTQAQNLVQLRLSYRQSHCADEDRADEECTWRHVVWVSEFVKDKQRSKGAVFIAGWHQMICAIVADWNVQCVIIQRHAPHTLHEKHFSHNSSFQRLCRANDHWTALGVPEGQTCSRCETTVDHSCNF